jgi:hypothetical protein
MRKTLLQLLWASALLTATANLAGATTVYLRDTPAPSHFVAGRSQSGAGTINSWNGTAGALDFEMNFSNSSSGWFSLITYCIDPVRYLSVGPANGTGSAFTLISMLDYFTSYTPAVSSPSTTTDKIQKLWANAYTDSLTTQTKAVAFQFLLWEYIADFAGTNFTSNIVRISDTNVRNQAISWDNALPNWTKTANLLVVSGYNTKQSFIYEDGTSTNDRVPEPSTYALIGAGLLGFAFVRRRR